jgi:glyoxylase-like metal-dependent hydrolase (beta-lactamase superfamily II)
MFGLDNALRGLGPAAISLALLLLAPALARAQAAPAGPAAYAFTLGAIEVTVVRDADIIRPNDGKVFGLTVGPEAVAKALTAAGVTDDKIFMSTDQLLVRTPGHLSLIDTGFGFKYHGVLIDSLALVGVKPDDITDIFITHSHTDHTGGLVGADGRPAFPKAVIRMSAKEWAWVQSKPDAQAQMAPVAAQVQPFEPGHEIFPGVTPLALYGHTPGHTAYRISSQGQGLTDIGDVVHSYILSVGKPDWAEGYDNDKAAGAAQRRAELQHLAETRERVFVGHFPFPGIGHIEPSGDSFVWKPIDPAR